MKNKYPIMKNKYPIMKNKFKIFYILAFVVLSACAQHSKQVEVVAELAIRPGNVAVSQTNRIFMSVHPLGGASDVQLIEILGKNRYRPFPTAAMQNKKKKATADSFDTLLGLRIDKNGVLWAIDMGFNLEKTRLWAIDIATEKVFFKYDFPKEIAPKGSFVQDLAVDASGGWVYLADIANPGILVLNTKTKELKRRQHPLFKAEDVDLMIDGKQIKFGGKPARVAINPITLSSDKKTLFFGAMNGTKLYSIATKHLQSKEPLLSEYFHIVGDKPISDGIATDADGNHYITNLGAKGIDVLQKNGVLKALARDERFDWSDNVAIGPDGTLFVAVNQLHKAPAFTGGDDLGKPPYFLLKIPSNHVQK